LLLAPADGGTPRKLTAKFELNAGNPVWAPDGKSIYFAAGTRQAVEIFSLEVSASAVKQVTQRGSVTSVTEISRDGRWLVGTLSGNTSPSEIYRANLSFTSFDTLTSHNAWLKEYALGESTVAKWKSKDGTEIEGVLTYPASYEKGRRVPLLLNPHGGPTGASINSWNATIQVLAANGFAVLQPNFRGSTGRGEAFMQANKNNWGKVDYDDCMTGVDAMIAQGLADAEKLGAFGWSYGGYMTFWILTQTDRFKAVSPGAGLTNIYSMYAQTDIPNYLHWFYSDKSPWEDSVLYWRHSPMAFVHQVKTPTLILHGQQDIRVPLPQAQEFYRALVERNIPVEFVIYPREGHGISEPRHQLDRMRRYVWFFTKYVSGPNVTEPAE
jgi:dipeptidyl aminopeptidase/acylaminoacyl peptidase